MCVLVLFVFSCFAQLTRFSSHAILPLQQWLYANRLIRYVLRTSCNIVCLARVCVLVITVFMCAGKCAPHETVLKILAEGSRRSCSTLDTVAQGYALGAVAQGYALSTVTQGYA